VTTIEGGGGNVLVFEGVFDYLTYRNYFSAITGTYLVLNSNSNLSIKVIDYISKYRCIHLYLDNDKSGCEATSKIIEHCINSNVYDKRKYYKIAKDLSEFVN